MTIYSRRSSLAGSIQGAGLTGLALWPARAARGEAHPPDAGDLAANAVAFLRPRQGRRTEAGQVTGNQESPRIVVTAMLRSGPSPPTIVR